MHEEAPAADITHDPRALARSLARYREPSFARSVLELLITVVPFALIWILMWASLRSGYWVCELLALPAAGFLVRLFMIQHDCGHGSFFRHRTTNDWVGRIVGVLTLTPYDFWRRTHGLHHATSGNLDHRGIGDVETLTVREYLALKFRDRIRYRLYRHPAVMFGLGPIYVFGLKYRLPFGFMRKGWTPWVSTMTTSAAIIAAASLMMRAVGVGPFLFVHLPIVLLGSTAGVWLFYVQHQFQGTSWDKADSWNVHDAALHGSSHYDLPGVLRWFTANIGLHHLHHLASRIPYYRLPDVLRDYPELRDVGRLTLTQSFKCVPLVLWDEESRRMVSFSDIKVATRSLRTCPRWLNAVKAALFCGPTTPRIKDACGK